jgi:hypothetical protein
MGVPPIPAAKIGRNLFLTEQISMSRRTNGRDAHFTVAHLQEMKTAVLRTRR